MSRLLLLLFFISTGNRLATADEYFDEFLDDVLDQARPVILDKNLNVIKLPNLSKEFSQKILFVTVYGMVGCYGGSAQSLATIYRTGEAEGALYPNGSAVAEASLGLRALSFSFEQCFVQLQGATVASSYVSGVVNENSIYLKAEAVPDYTVIKVTIDEIHLRELGGVEFRTGSSIFHKLADEILKDVVKAFHALIFQGVENALQQLAGRSFIIDNPVSDRLRKLRRDE